MIPTPERHYAEQLPFFPFPSPTPIKAIHIMDRTAWIIIGISPPLLGLDIYMGDNKGLKPPHSAHRRRLPYVPCPVAASGGPPRNKASSTKP